MTELRGPRWVTTAKDGVIYMRMHGLLTRAVVDATRAMHIEALRQRPNGVGILLEVAEQPMLPPADVRDYASQVVREHPEGIRGHCTIMPGTGFFAAASRAALTGIFMMAQSPYPRAIVKTPLDGVRYLRMRLGASAPDEQAMLNAFWSLHTRA
jgi:hypothetical protein